MEPTIWRYFVQIVESGSLSEASKRLRISQPSLTRAIQQLEGFYETPLLVRHRRGIQLTPSGQIAYEGGVTILRKLEEVKTTIQSDLDSPTGTLTIALSDVLGNYVFPAFAKNFIQKYPGIRLSMRTGNASFIQSALQSELADIGYFFHLPDHPGFVFKNFKKFEFAIVYSSRMKQKPSSLKALGLYIGSPHLDYQTTNLAGRLLQRIGYNDSPGMEANSLEMQKRIVLSGIGFTLVPKLMVQAELDRKELLEFPLRSPLFGQSYEVRKKAKLPSKCAKIFSEEFRKILA
jgi:DNA-binding transcriptional LysR family regulator